MPVRNKRPITNEWYVYFLSVWSQCISAVQLFVYLRTARLQEKNEQQTLPFSWHLQKRIMPINRHVFRRMSRCPLGIVQLCFSLFLWLYQYILGPNYQDKLGPVEHHWFEGKSHQFVCVTNIFNLRENFGLFLKLLIGRTHR